MIEKDILGHDGGDFLEGENLVPLDECICQVLDDFPELLFGEISLLIFAGGNLETEGVNEGFVGNLR